MSGAKASQSEELIRGKYVIKGRLLDVLFDSSATHSFVSVDCVKCLDLHVTELPCNVMVTTPTEIPRLLSQGTWENTVDTKAFMVMLSIEDESGVEPEYILVVRDFLEVFPEDVSELPPEREIQFAIDLIPRASPISVVLYRMSPVELAEVKKQVEDLLQKQFVRRVCHYGEHYCS
ncbi:uncharacterized protein LOC113855204 [Abrus precatorius]|uniref:Uncharacterized protein LOC113855204 n=1 Tax=Abrus precatorius TaxID=3816 RepID=A0A8B8KHZ9_ABRPR|nr:uncharacterized protein LOC113855204 [Abrus precatorius]